MFQMDEKLFAELQKDCCWFTMPIFEDLPNIDPCITIREAAEYSNIGINKIDKLLRSPNCPFVLYVGTKKLVKRKEFEEFLGKELII